MRVGVERSKGMSMSLCTATCQSGLLGGQVIEDSTQMYHVMGHTQDDKALASFLQTGALSNSEHLLANQEQGTPATQKLDWVRRRLPRAVLQRHRT